MNLPNGLYGACPYYGTICASLFSQKDHIPIGYDSWNASIMDQDYQALKSEQTAVSFT